MDVSSVSQFFLSYLDLFMIPREYVKLKETQKHTYTHTHTHRPLKRVGILLCPCGRRTDVSLILTLSRSFAIAKGLGNHSSQGMSLVTGVSWCLQAGTTWEKEGPAVALVNQQALPAELLQMRTQRNAELVLTSFLYLHFGI